MNQDAFNKEVKAVLESVKREQVHKAIQARLASLTPDCEEKAFEAEQRMHAAAQSCVREGEAGLLGYLIFMTKMRSRYEWLVSHYAT